jgi:hypothetical protein
VVVGADLYAVGGRRDREEERQREAAREGIEM